MARPKHDPIQSAMWKDQIKRDLHGYTGPSKADIQRRDG